MAVVLRLARVGAPKKPFYRIIASEKGTKRDSKFIEIVGTLDPMTNPARATLKVERIKHWVNNGAQPTDRVRDVIRKEIPNFLEGRASHQRAKILAARKSRKARLASKGGMASKGGSPAKAAAKKK